MTETPETTDAKPERDERGRWAAGNLGRPRGARHKSTEAALALLEGEATALTRREVEAALAGDGAALRLCLKRIIPPRKDAAVTFHLPPLQTAQDVAQAATAVLAAVADGDLTPGEGTAVMGLVDAARKALEMTALEYRIARLEARLGRRWTPGLPGSKPSPGQAPPPPKSSSA